MDLLTYLESGKETDRAPWVVVLGQLRQIEDLIQETEMLDIFQVLLYPCLTLMVVTVAAKADRI